MGQSEYLVTSSGNSFSSQFIPPSDFQPTPIISCKSTIGCDDDFHMAATEFARNVCNLNTCLHGGKNDKSTIFFCIVMFFCKHFMSYHVDVSFYKSIQLANKILQIRDDHFQGSSSIDPSLVKAFSKFDDFFIVFQHLSLPFLKKEDI